MSGRRGRLFQGFSVEDELDELAVQIVFDVIKSVDRDVRPEEILPLSNVYDLGLDPISTQLMGAKLKEILKLEKNDTTFDHLGEEDLVFGPITMGRLAEIVRTSDPALIRAAAEIKHEASVGTTDVAAANAGVTHGWVTSLRALLPWHYHHAQIPFAEPTAGRPAFARQHRADVAPPRI